MLRSWLREGVWWVGSLHASLSTFTLSLRYCSRWSRGSFLAFSVGFEFSVGLDGLTGVGRLLSINPSVIKLSE